MVKIMQIKSAITNGTSAAIEENTWPSEKTYDKRILFHT